MRTRWTLEKCLEISSRYDSLLEFRRNHNDAFCAANRNGWKDQVFKNLSKNDTKWKLKSSVIKEAEKHNSINEFRKNAKGAYEACKKNKWDSDVFKDMEKKTGFWNDYEKCKIEALKYKSRQAFMRNSSGAYQASIRNDWLEDVCVHIPSKHKNWTKIEIMNVASRYSSRDEFSKNNKGAYLFALRRGWLDEVCKEMTPVFNTWTREKCFELIKKYKSKSEFSKKNGSAAQYAKRNGFYEELVSGFDLLGNLFNRMIYAYEFSDNRVYIGLTYKESKRKNEHLERGPVSKHSKKVKLKPEYKALTNYIDVKQAQVKEENFIKEYEKNGWILLNRSKAGALGGNKRIWTKEECKKIVKKFSSVKDLMNSIEYNTVYQAIKKNKWGNDLFSNLTKKIYWNREKCEVEARKCKSKQEFMRKFGGGYNYAKRNSFLDNLKFNHK